MLIKLANGELIVGEVGVGDDGGYIINAPYQLAIIPDAKGQEQVTIINFAGQFANVEHPTINVCKQNVLYMYEVNEAISRMYTTQRTGIELPPSTAPAPTSRIDQLVT